MNLKIFTVYFLSFFSLSFAQIKFKIWKNCTRPGLAALTFDDGPSPNGGTESVLNVLREKNVTATFFVTGEGWDTTYLDADERKQNLLRQIYEDGHQIGSHTWKHLDLNKVGQTKKKILEDVFRLADTVYNILGVNMTVFRFPFGSTNYKAVKFIEKELGYKNVRWNLDSNDWAHKKNVEASFQMYLQKMKGDLLPTTKSFIILHHDPAPRSGEFASRAIDYIRSKGFKLVTVGECIGVPNFV